MICSGFDILSHYWVAGVIVVQQNLEIYEFQQDNYYGIQNLKMENRQSKLDSLVQSIRSGHNIAQAPRRYRGGGEQDCFPKEKGRVFFVGKRGRQFFRAKIGGNVFRSEKGGLDFLMA